MNFTMLVDIETSSPAYSIMNNVTFNLSFHIREVTTNVTEEQAIQESFDAAVVVQIPASRESINLFERKIFEVEENIHDKVENICMICLEPFRKQQCLLCIHCGNRFCAGSILSWLQLNGTCSLCRYCLV